VADHYELKVVDGTIPLPDLRIHYIDAEGQQHHEDLELVTRRASVLKKRSKKLRRSERAISSLPHLGQTWHWRLTNGTGLGLPFSE
jgi:hypothetical protein